MSSGCETTMNPQSEILVEDELIAIRSTRGLNRLTMLHDSTNVGKLLVPIYI